MKILVYHHIKSDPAYRQSMDSDSAKRSFERQMDYLFRSGYGCIAMADYLENRNDPRWNHQCFVLTFDDGYEDFYTTVNPVLSHYQFTATVFLVSDLIGKTSDWEKEKGTPLMNWDQIRELEQAGISFGSHTCRHVDLSTAGQQEVVAEVKNSKDTLERELGHAVEWIAYPYGKSNSEVQAACQTLGYQAAFGSATGKPNLYNLWRVSCEVNDSNATLAYKLSPAFDAIKSLKRWAREETPAGTVWHKLRRSMRGG